MAKDYYKTLGIEKTRRKTKSKLRSANLLTNIIPTKKAAMREKFKEISEAYSVLSDDNKRKQYDTFGSAGPNMGGGGFNGNGV